MISAKDKEQLAQKGISEEKLNEQLNWFSISKTLRCSQR